MPTNLEAVVLANVFDDGVESRVAKFNDLVALLTMQVVVFGITVVVLVNFSVAHIDAPQQPSIDKFVERPIDRRSADLETISLEFVDQLIRVEMVVLAKDETNQVALLFRETLRAWTTCQVFSEFLFRRLGYFDCGWQVHNGAPSGRQRGWAIDSREPSSLRRRNSSQTFYQK